MRALSLRRDLGQRRSVPALGRAALGLRWQACVYAGGLENHPALLERLERRGIVIGNGSAVLRRLREPARFFRFLASSGIPHPPTLTRRPASGPRPLPAKNGAWLFKPRRSGGGLRLRTAATGERQPRGFYRQLRVRGVPGSIVFAANGRRAAIMGVSVQLNGWPELGASGFRYCGSVAGPPIRLLPGRALVALAGAATLITRRFGLRGLNGLDFVLEGGTPLVLEVNPRFTASMELFESSRGGRLLDAHLDACLSGRLPRGPVRMRSFVAKGILYATRRCRWRAVRPPRWIDLRDRPAVGEILEAGGPVCTLVVRAPSADACRRRLRGAAAWIRGRLAAAGRPKHGARAGSHRPAPLPVLR